VTVETPQPAELAAVLASQGVRASVSGNRLVLRGTSKAVVSQLAYDSGIRLVELTENSQSLEDSLLDLTRASTEFAAA